MSHEEDGNTLRKRGRVVVVDRAADVEVPLENILWPDSTDITEEQIHNMATSLMTTGQIEPIVIGQADKKGMHRGIVGRLRWEGMKYRWRNEPQGKTILCRIRRFKDDIDGLIEVKSWQLVENLHRREIPAMQRAKQYRELYDLMIQKHGEKATLNTLATQIEELTGNKESIKTVQHYLELTKLQPRTQEILTGEKLSLRAGLEFARVTDPKKQVKAAEDVAKSPDHYRDVQSIHWHVESLVDDERRDRQKQRLEKRAKQLREEGKIVYIEGGYSYVNRKFEVFYNGVPEECKAGEQCAKLGILLSGNFQQKPICTDPKCYENIQKKQSAKEAVARRENEKQLELERAKVYSMPLDERHWRIAVYGLIDSWDLQELLGLERAKGEDPAWVKLSQLTLPQLQTLLVEKAVEDLLSSHIYGHENVIKWIVEQFGLTPKLFLKEE